MLPILLALLFLFLLGCVVIAGRPDQFAVSRSISLAAPPEKVFPFINDLHQWQAWSPWAKLDPNAKNSFEGAPFGVGAAMSWAGNKKVGQGKMTILESRPAEFVQFRLEFIRPFKATNQAEFHLQRQATQTVLTWTMVGKNNLFFKVFGLFVNCDEMCGRDFEKGLAALKAIVENP